MEARSHRHKLFFSTFLILTVIIIGFLTNISICSQIPVDISNSISNIDPFSMLLPILAAERLRDKRGRFTSLKDSKNVKPLPQQILDALPVSLLGDGWIGLKKKTKKKEFLTQPEMLLLQWLLKITLILCFYDLTFILESVLLLFHDDDQLPKVVYLRHSIPLIHGLYLL